MYSFTHIFLTSALGECSGQFHATAVLPLPVPVVSTIFQFISQSYRDNRPFQYTTVKHIIWLPSTLEINRRHALTEFNKIHLMVLMEMRCEFMQFYINDVEVCLLHTQWPYWLAYRFQIKALGHYFTELLCMGIA